MDTTEIIPAGYYQCALCHGIYEKGWSEEEAREEREKKYGTLGLTEEDFALTCDDCHTQIADWQKAEREVLTQVFNEEYRRILVENITAAVVEGFVESVCDEKGNLKVLP